MKINKFNLIKNNCNKCICKFPVWLKVTRKWFIPAYLVLCRVLFPTKMKGAANPRGSKIKATVDSTALLVKGFSFTSTVKWKVSEATHQSTLSALSTLGSPKSKSKAVAPSEHSFFGIVAITFFAVGEEFVQAEFSSLAKFLVSLYKLYSFSFWVHTCQAIVNIKIMFIELHRSLIKLAFTLCSKRLEAKICTTRWGGCTKPEPSWNKQIVGLPWSHFPTTGTWGSLDPLEQHEPGGTYVQCHTLLPPDLYGNDTRLQWGYLWDQALSVNSH